MINDETKNYIDQAIRTHIHDGNFAQRINYYDLFGNIRTVSAVPTGVPANVFGQLLIYHNGATIRLYIYDFSDNAWHYTALT